MFSWGWHTNMTREIPYEPIREPRKEVSHDDMLAILNKHADRIGVPLPKPQESKVEVTVIPNPPRLEWNKPEKGATGVRTTCGRYSCSKVMVNGKTSYELWKLVPDASWFKSIAIGLDSFETAKKKAEEDLCTR